MFDSFLLLIISAAAGSAGGLARLLISGKGIIPLPRMECDIHGRSMLNLGFLFPLLIGSIAGVLVNRQLHIDGIISFISGYFGSDFIENAVERWGKTKTPPQ